jgi:ABC-2 type transport system ATP-binding protein
MEMETLVAVESISRNYGDLQAVTGVSFTVRRGEVLGFLGPNGAGKTTTMNVLTGVLAPSAGRVMIADHDLLAAPRRAKAHIGYLPERPPLYLDLSVDEYLRYAGRLRGLKGTALNAAVQSCKARCGLGATGERLIRNLSKGYQQRVGIAQAIIHSPAVVVLDEPTLGLDPIQIREIRALIRQLGEDHSVILSTHILPEVQTVCNRVLIIHAGRIVLDRPLAALAAGGEHLALQIALRRPPPMESLKAIEGVQAVMPIDGRRFRIEHARGAPTAELLVKAAADNGWGLYELAPERDFLETTFLRLTGGDGDTGGGDPAAP